MIKKYDWNVIVLNDITTVMIKKLEEAGDFSDFVEVKRVSKPAPVTKKAKEAEDVKRRPRRNEEGFEEDFFDRRDNYKGVINGLY